jgi:hypothetical protein
MPLRSRQALQCKAGYVLGTTSADVAVWVAIGSAFVSLTSLIWQLTLYRLSGPRPVVRLMPAVLTETGHLIKGPPKGWRTSLPPDLNIVDGRPWVDAAVIEVVNIGRAPISVSSIGLDLGANSRWRPWVRHTIAMHSVPVHGASAEAEAVRLKVGQSVTVIVDPWLAIRRARQKGRHARLRASVVPAGRHAVRSKWRQRWTVDSEQRYLWPFGPEGDQVDLFQSIWRVVAPYAPEQVYSTWIGICALLLPSDVDVQSIEVSQISQVLASLPGDATLPFSSSFEIWGAVRELGKPGAWTP